MDNIKEKYGTIGVAHVDWNTIKESASETQRYFYNSAKNSSRPNFLMWAEV